MSVPPDGDDYHELVARMKRLEEDAFGEFAKTFGPRLVKYFTRHGMGMAEAEDLAVTCITDIALRINKYDPADHADFARWVFFFARRKLSDWWRSRPEKELSTSHLHYDVAQEEPPDEPQDESEAERNLVLAVRESLDRLPEVDRTIILLRHLEEDCSYDEIAERLHITRSAARVRHFRALERLKDLIETDPRIRNYPRGFGRY